MPSQALEASYIIPMYPSFPFVYSMMDAASSAMGSSQPVEGLQQLLGASGLDASALLSFFGESKEQQPSHPAYYPVSKQSPESTYASRGTPSSSSSPVSDVGFQPSPESMEPLREEVRTYTAPPAKAPFEDQDSPVSAAQLASALVAAADAAQVRGAAASPSSGSFPKSSSAGKTREVVNNIVPAPQISSVHVSGGALSSASGDEEPAAPVIPKAKFSGEICRTSRRTASARTL